MGFRSGAFTVTTGQGEASRAPEEATAAEKRIGNFWVFQYDVSGNIMINPRYYTVPAGQDPDQPVVMPIQLKATDAACTICVVANTSSEEGQSKYTSCDKDFCCGGQGNIRTSLPVEAKGSFPRRDIESEKFRSG